MQKNRCSNLGDKIQEIFQAFSNVILKSFEIIHVVFQIYFLQFNLSIGCNKIKVQEMRRWRELKNMFVVEIINSKIWAFRMCGNINCISNLLLTCQHLILMCPYIQHGILS